MEEEGGEGRGYRCVATPSPTPGASASLLMTWGDIESTLLTLEAIGTPLLRGAGAGIASFRVSEMPRRDMTAHALERSGRRRSSSKGAGALGRRKRPREGGGSAVVGLSPAAVLPVKRLTAHSGVGHAAPQRVPPSTKRYPFSAAAACRLPLFTQHKARHFAWYNSSHDPFSLRAGG